MKQIGIVLLLSAALSLPAAAAPLSNNARTVIPQAVQQIISVDYSELRDSPMARALKDQVIPDNVKQFESALRSVGIDPDRDVEQITFATYRGPKNVCIRYRHCARAVPAEGVPGQGKSQEDQAGKISVGGHLPHGLGLPVGVS